MKTVNIQRMNAQCTAIWYEICLQSKIYNCLVKKQEIKKLYSIFHFKYTHKFIMEYNFEFFSFLAKECIIYICIYIYIHIYMYCRHILLKLINKDLVLSFRYCNFYVGKNGWRLFQKQWQWPTMVESKCTQIVTSKTSYKSRVPHVMGY